MPSTVFLMSYDPFFFINSFILTTFVRVYDRLDVTPPLPPPLSLPFLPLLSPPPPPPPLFPLPPLSRSPPPPSLSLPHSPPLLPPLPTPPPYTFFVPPANPFILPRKSSLIFEISCLVFYHSKIVATSTCF